MHLVAIRREVYEKNPWIAAKLYRAFADAKNFALARMRFSGSQSYMLPWQFADVDEIDEVFGADPWPYGIAANRPTLDASHSIHGRAALHLPAHRANRIVFAC